MDEDILTSQLTNIDDIAKLITPFLSGVDRLGEELTRSDNVGIKRMLIGNYDVYFEKGGHVQAALVVDPSDESELVSSALETIIDEFETQFSKTLGKWNGAVDNFKNFRKYTNARINRAIKDEIVTKLVKIFRKNLELRNLDHELGGILSRRGIPVEIFFQEKDYSFDKMWDKWIDEMRHHFGQQPDIDLKFPDVHISQLEKINQSYHIKNTWSNPIIQQIWSGDHEFKNLAHEIIEPFDSIVEQLSKTLLSDKIIQTFSRVFNMYKKSFSDMNHLDIIRNVVIYSRLATEDAEDLYFAIAENQGQIPGFLITLEGARETISMLEKYVFSYDEAPLLD